jgi:hypothetical protein
LSFRIIDPAHVDTGALVFFPFAVDFDGDDGSSMKPELLSDDDELELVRPGRDLGGGVDGMEVVLGGATCAVVLLFLDP